MARNSNNASNITGPRIKAMREYKGLTQKRVVELLAEYGVRMAASTMSKIECGDRAVNDYELVAFSKVYEVSIDELFD